MNNRHIDLEDVARLIHQGWTQYQIQRGMVYGLERTETTHPHLVEWNELDDESKNQDRFIAAVLIQDWVQNKLAPEDLHIAIHNAWALSVCARGKEHPHAVPFHAAHSKDLAEHRIQADLLRSYLATRSTSRIIPLYERRCLALLPFREHTLSVFDEVIETSIREAGYIPIRADRLRSPQSIHDEVLDQIELCTCVIADITDDNPNVNYEIGLARSLGKPIIMITASRDPASVPFYYKGQRVHFYDRNQPDWKEQLSNFVRLSLAGPVRLDPLSENQRIGLTGLFRADDNSFEAELKRQISQTSQRIVAVGWGLAFINRQRREVMQVLREQVIKQAALTVHIILARPDHPGLIERIKEEEEFQPETGRLTDWQHEFFKFAQELPNNLAGFARERVFVRRISYLPTCMVVLLDDVYFFRCYGPPNTGGWQSPWLRCQRSLASGIWTGFLDNIIDQAIQYSFDPENK